MSRQLIMNNDLYLVRLWDVWKRGVHRVEIKTDRRRGGREADRGVNNGRVL